MTLSSTASSPGGDGKAACDRVGRAACDRVGSIGVCVAIATMALI